LPDAQALSGGSEQEFVTGIAQTSEPKADEAGISPQMCEDHLDLLALAAADLKVLCARQLTGALAGPFKQPHALRLMGAPCEGNNDPNYNQFVYQVTHFS